MKNFKDSILSEASERLGSSISTIMLEAATLPISIQKLLEPTTGGGSGSLTICTLNFIQAIREQRQAEYEFFRSHPELNP
jgi:hypothetical protein